MSSLSRSPSLESSTAAPVRVALLGVGTVGSAVLQRLLRWRQQGHAQALQLVSVSNSRYHVSADGICPQRCADLFRELKMADELTQKRLRAQSEYGLHEASLEEVAARLGAGGTRVIIDATASGEVTAQHAGWLERGIHVVTACKLGQGGRLTQWQNIWRARVAGATHYGDSATVGAGLPLIRSLDELRAGGDEILGIAGILSGSLAWLFNHYDGMRPFSQWLRQAGELGFTEPDARDDLSGEDVRRKIVILARAAGYALEADAVRVSSLVPMALRGLTRDEFALRMEELDAPLRAHYAKAYKNGEKLRFIARLTRDTAGMVHASVGLEALPATDPLAGGSGTDNRVAIWSDRYRNQPLVIQGPGAGAEVTAAGLLDDVLRIVRSA